MLAPVNTNNRFSVFGKKMHSNDSVCTSSRVYTTALSKLNFLKLRIRLISFYCRLFINWNHAFSPLVNVNQLKVWVADVSLKAFLGLCVRLL